MIDRNELLSMPASDYMNSVQLDYFKQLLVARREDLRARIANARKSLGELELPADISDMGTVEQERTAILADIRRSDSAVKDVSEALERIRQDEYGFCLMTGEEIGLERLLSNPAARYCVHSQEIIERKNGVMAA